MAATLSSRLFDFMIPPIDNRGKAPRYVNGGEVTTIK
jgi:hypothetical protein